MKTINFDRESINKTKNYFDVTKCKFNLQHVLLKLCYNVIMSIFSQLTVRFREFASYGNSFECLPIFSLTQTHLTLCKLLQNTYQKPRHALQASIMAILTT